MRPKPDFDGRDGEARTVISTDLRLQAPFVRSDAGPLRAALVVKPSPALANVRPIYGESNAIAERSVEQFDVFVGRLTALGIKTHVAQFGAAAPLGSLCADAAVMFADGAFLMRPSDPGRRGEVAAIEARTRR